MAPPIRRELTVPAETRFLAQVRAVVLDVLQHSALQPVKASMVALAVDEAVANIMEHAYAEDRPAGAPRDTDIRIVLDVDARRLEVLIRDRGAAFDPRTLPEVNMDQHVRSGKKGGLGVFLIRKIMDEIHYTYKHGHHNELQMIKYLDAPAAKTPPAPGGRGSSGLLGAVGGTPSGGGRNG